MCIRDSYTVDFGNKNNSKLWRVNHTLSNTTIETLIIAFESQEHIDDDYRFFYLDLGVLTQYWNETFFDWKDTNLDFNVINYEHGGMDKWYYITHSVIQDKEYRFRAWVDIPFGRLNGTDGKYWWALKPSSESIHEAIQNNHFYALDPWWDSNWNFFRTITLASSFIDNPLNEFPILVKIPDATADKCDGGDSIRFLNTDNSTEYPYEIEDWTDGNDRLVWVNISRVESGSDTVILMYYNNSGASDNQQPTKVWNSEYLAVYHLNDASGNPQDSTVNENDLLNYGADYGATGAVGDGMALVIANTDWLTCPISSGLEPEMSFECWTLFTDVDATTDYVWITDEQTADYYYRMVSHTDYGNNFRCSAYDTSSGYRNIEPDTTTIKVDIFYHFQYTLKENSDTYLYVNGTQEGTIAVGTLKDHNTVTNCNYLGRYYTESGYLGGTLDEVRFSTTRRNASWAKADYHTQNYSNGFLAWGSEVSAPPPNNAPVQSSPLVWDGTTADINHTDVIIPVVSFNITIADQDADKMTLTVRSNESGTWQDVNSSGNLGNGTYSNNTNVSWVDSYNTKYWISFNLTDGTDWDNNTYYFTTEANTAPVNSNPYPSNGAIDIPITPTTINITVADVDDAEQDMTITFRTNESGSWQDADTNASVNNGTYYCLNTLWVDTGTTKYWWSVNTTDSCGGWDNDTYYFTTEPLWSNSNPVNSNPVPTNGATGISVSPSQLNITINDLDDANQSMDITFRTNASGTWKDADTNNTVSNGTYYCLNTTWVTTYNTKYWWSVNTSDNHSTPGWDNDTYCFTTRGSFQQQSPPARTHLEGVYENNTLVSIEGKIKVSKIGGYQGSWAGTMQQLLNKNVDDAMTYNTSEFNISSSNPAYIYVNLPNATNISWFRFYYYNETDGLDFCPAIYDVYNASTYIESFNYTASVNGQWIRCNLTNEILACTNFTLRINETYGNNPTRVSIVCIQVFNRTTPPVKPTQDSISYFEEIPEWWNGLQWAISLSLDDVCCEDNVKSNYICLVQPLTISAWHNEMDSDEYNDTYIDDYHIEYASHGSTLDYGAHWEQGYLWWYGRGQDMIAEESDIIRTSQWGALSNASKKDNLITYRAQSSSISPDGCKALLDIGLRHVSNWGNDCNSWAIHIQQNISSYNVSYPNYPIEWLEIARGARAKDTSYSVDGGDTRMNQIRDNGSYCVSYIHPGETIDSDYKSYIENDLLGWHATQGEVVSYRWLRDWTNVTYNTTASSETIKAYDINIQNTDTRLWEVPLTFKFNLTGFNWDGTPRIYWQNDTLYNNSLDNISGFSTGSGHHINQTMREGYRWNATSNELWISVCPGNQTSSKSIYLYSISSLDIDVSPDTWISGTVGVNTDIQENFTFWQNGSATIDIKIGINCTNFTYVNYTDWLNLGHDRYYANFTNDSWATEHMIEPGYPSSSVLDSSFAPGSFAFGVRIGMPRTITYLSKREDFLIVLVVSESS